ncbi:hypothetical protein [Streptomyces sp. YIM 130001]|uniref:hypothetical protein n=1 Tax=Streptomyces sp. YIM 130001 TaxID=2259644 RepID=UPI0013C4416B|nr:hypothetical protein [Streptomyces sp. YIM 130001]
MAVGTGSYDGGYAFEGELLIIDLGSGRSTSVIRGPREVLHVEWAGEQALQVVVAPPDDDGLDEAHTHGFAVTLRQRDWSDVPRGSVPQEELTGRWVEFERRKESREATDRIVESLAALAREPSWKPRRRVWDVHVLKDGRVLACLDEVLAELWSPDGRLEWRVPDDEGGRQLVVRAGELDAWVNVERWQVRQAGREWVTAPPLVARVSLTDGRVLDTLRLGASAVLATRDDGWLALRSRSTDRYQQAATALVRPAGEVPEARVPLGKFDLFNHSFPIRRSSFLLFLQGTGETPWRDKWVVAVDPAGTDGEPRVRPLFPHDWETGHAHLFGGPGVEVGAGESQDLVHAGTVFEGAVLRPGTAFVVRRSLGDGAARWVFTADSPVTALDGDEDTVYVTLNSGELVALRGSDGTVRWRQRLELGGHPVVPLSLVLTGPGRLLIGTVDGRIIDCSVAHSPGP